MRFLSQIEGHTLWAPALSANSVVLDFGANKGNFSRGILEQYGCRCFAVEANPGLSAIIPAHPRLSVYNLALAAKSGKHALHLSTNHEASTILTTTTGDKYQSIEVDAISMPDFLKRIGLTTADVIKFDIEGAEIEVLDSCTDEFLTSVGQLTIEFHDFMDLTPVSTVERVVGRLESLGFYTLKMWRLAWGDTLFVNRRRLCANRLALAWSRYGTRNWWGLTRMVQRAAKGKETSKRPDAAKREA